MKENYLHDKIRQHEERLQKIEDTHKPIDEIKQEVTKTVTNIMKQSFDKYIMQLRDEYDTTIKNNYIEHMEKSKKETKRFINHEINTFSKEVVDVIKYEKNKKIIVLERTKMSFDLCIALMLRKNIMTPEEFKKLEEDIARIK